MANDLTAYRVAVGLFYNRIQGHSRNYVFHSYPLKSMLSQAVCFAIQTKNTCNPSRIELNKHYYFDTIMSSFHGAVTRYLQRPLLLYCYFDSYHGHSECGKSGYYMHRHIKC